MIGDEAKSRWWQNCCQQCRRIYKLLVTGWTLHAYWLPYTHFWCTMRRISQDTSFTVIRRQESSKYNPSQTTPSMLRWFSPLSEVEDCWTTSIVQGSSRQATTTDTIHQSTIEITQWRDCCPGRVLHWGDHTTIDRPKTHDYIRFHRHKTHWEVTNQCHKSNHKLSCAPANQTTSLTLNQSSIAIVGTSM